MTTPIIQIDAAQPGNAKLGIKSGSTVTLSDVTGAVPDSRVWTIIAWPGPDESPPVLSSSSAEVTTCVPQTDGCYIVKLDRTVDGVVETAFAVFGVEDEHGFHMPAAGQTGEMMRLGDTIEEVIRSQIQGWAGGAGNNSQLDGLLRFLRRRVYDTPTTVLLQLHSTSVSLGETGSVILGSAILDKSKYPASATFRLVAVAETTNDTKPATVELRTAVIGEVLADADTTSIVAQEISDEFAAPDDGPVLVESVLVADADMEGELVTCVFSAIEVSWGE